MYNNMMSTEQNQIDFDYNKLARLGFKIQEIELLQYIIQCGGRVTTNNLMSFNLDYRSLERIKYMYSICLGKNSIESSDELCKHLKKMNKHLRRLGMQDLALSSIGEIPRTAIVYGIPDGTFSIWNSDPNDEYNIFYKVSKVTHNNIIIETTKKPVIKYKQDKFIDGVLEILDLDDNGVLKVSINKQYCKLCNRFVVVASFKRPEFHLGLCEIICIEGTKVYIYAKSIGSKDSISYNSTNQRVYDYGYYCSDIQNKLKVCSTKMYKRLCGVYANLEPPNSDFKLISEEKDSREEFEIE